MMRALARLTRGQTYLLLVIAGLIDLLCWNALLKWLAR